MEENPTTILRKLMKEAGVSQQQLALLCGVSQPVVSYWVRGTARPGPDRMPTLRRVLHLPEEVAPDHLSLPPEAFYEKFGDHDDSSSGSKPR